MDGEFELNGSKSFWCRQNTVDKRFSIISGEVGQCQAMPGNAFNKNEFGEKDFIRACLLFAPMLSNRNVSLTEWL